MNANAKAETDYSCPTQITPKCDDAMMKREEIEWDLDEVYIEEVSQHMHLCTEGARLCALY